MRLKIGFLILWILLNWTAGAQVNVNKTFVMVGTYGSFAGSDSTFTGPITFFADQLGESYFPTQIDSGFIAVDGFRNFYRVDSIWNQTFSTASIRLIDLATPYAGPTGTGQVYDPLTVDSYLIPPPPVNSTGVTSNYVSAAHINNLSRMVSSFLEFSGLDTVARNATLTGNGTLASPLAVSPSVYQDSVNTIFNNSDFSESSTHFLFEDALGSWSSRFRSPSTNNYFTITSDTTDSDFIGLAWNTLGGNGKVGHRLDGYYLEFGDDLYINSTNSLDRMYMTYTFDTDNTNTQALTIDPITGEVELVDVGTDLPIDNIGLGDTLYYGLEAGVQKFKSILSGSYTTITAADSTLTIDADPPLGKADQTLTGDRLVSGSNTYDLRIDSIPFFELAVDEFFLSEDRTTVGSLVSTTNRFLKQNAGVFRVNSLGLDYTILQNTNGTDQLHGMYAEEDRIRIISSDKEVVGVNSNSTNAIFKPNDFELNVKDSLGVTHGQLFADRSKLLITNFDSLNFEFDMIPIDEGQTFVLAVDTLTGRIYTKTSTFGSVLVDQHTNGALSVDLYRVAGASSILQNPAAGEYTVVMASSSDVSRIDVESNNTTLNGSNELVFRMDNSVNGLDRFFSAELIDLGSNGLIDAHATGTNYTQSVSGNITTIRFPNMNGFGAAGYRILLR